MRFLALIVGLVSLVAAAGELELKAPWLTVYDSSGRPRWEISLAKLVKTDTGWEGKTVKVRVYWQGELEFELAASRLTADRLGNVWQLSGDISGRAEDLSLTCQAATWKGGLIIKELTVKGETLALSAAEAHWSEGKEVLLTKVSAESSGWRVTLPRATYVLDTGLLRGQEAEITGHGYRITAEELEFSTRDGVLHLQGAKVVAGS